MDQPSAVAPGALENQMGPMVYGPGQPYNGPLIQPVNIDGLQQEFPAGAPYPGADNQAAPLPLPNRLPGQAYLGTDGDLPVMNLDPILQQPAQAVDPSWYPPPAIVGQGDPWNTQNNVLASDANPFQGYIQNPCGWVVQDPCQEYDNNVPYVPICDIQVCIRRCLEHYGYEEGNCFNNECYCRKKEPVIPIVPDKPE